MKPPVKSNHVEQVVLGFFIFGNTTVQHRCKKKHERSCTLTWTPFTPVSSSAIILNTGVNRSSSAGHPTGAVLSRQPPMKLAGLVYIRRCRAAQRCDSALL